jgi:hypothetical protein
MVSELFIGMILGRERFELFDGIADIGGGIGEAGGEELLGNGLDLIAEFGLPAAGGRIADAERFGDSSLRDALSRKLDESADLLRGRWHIEYLL